MARFQTEQTNHTFHSRDRTVGYRNDFQCSTLCDCWRVPINNKLVGSRKYDLLMPVTLQYRQAIE